MNRIHVAIAAALFASASLAAAAQATTEKPATAGKATTEKPAAASKAQAVPAKSDAKKEEEKKAPAKKAAPKPKPKKAETTAKAAPKAAPKPLVERTTVSKTGQVTKTYSTGPAVLRDKDGNVIPTNPDAYNVDSAFATPPKSKSGR